MAGSLGGFMGAYMMLRAKDDSSSKPRRDDLMHYVSHPQPCSDAAGTMSKLRMASAACDLSDGLADAIEIFCGDEVGIAVDIASLPTHALALESARVLGLDPVALAFGVGDWALAYVLPAEHAEKFAAIQMSNQQLVIVGEFTADIARVLVGPDGVRRPVPTIMNEHFRARLEDEASSRYAQLFADPTTGK